MKKIKFENYTLGDSSNIITNRRKHSVWLNWDQSFEFTDIKKLNKFLADTNRFYNEKLFDMNQYHADIFSIYKDNYFDLNHKNGEAEIEQSFRVITKTFKLIFNRSWNEQQLFKWMIQILENLKFILSIIVKLHKSRNNWALSHKYEFMIKRIENLKNECLDYGKTLPCFVGKNKKTFF